MRAETTRAAIPLAAVALISGAALAYEILLTRIFAIVHWHHLVATAISLALLGYGASGTFLSLTGTRLTKHFAAAFVGNAALFALTISLSVASAQRIPLDPEALTWEPRQTLFLSGTFIVLAVPFFFAANCIGLALWRFPGDISRVYGIDLLGAGAGALGVVVALIYLHPGDALLAISLIGLLGVLLAAVSLRWRPRAVSFLVTLLAALVVMAGRVEVVPAPYKALARVLTIKGAQVDHATTGATGTLTVVRNDEVPLRSAPGLSLLATHLPPQQLAVFLDGDTIGALARAQSDQSLAYLRDLTSALPYTLLSEPAVLILDAGTGENVLQALAHGARRVDAIEPNPLLVSLVCGPYREYSGDLCHQDQVQWHIVQPRAFLAATDRQFDLIAIGARADKAGLNSQRETFEITTEALVHYLRHLTSDGVLMIHGPTRLPPRLVPRLIETARSALHKIDIPAPEQHLVVIRGWQQFALLVKREPLSVTDLYAIREFTRERAFDLIWLPDISRDEVNRYQRLAEPMFYNDAARRLSPGLDADLASAHFRQEPATDDRPYPYRFSTWSALARVFSHNSQSTHSRNADLDLGFFIAVSILAQAVVVSLVLIILPLTLQRGPARPARGRFWRWRTALYFSSVGFAFLFVEIAWLQRMQLYIGHPVYTAAVVLATFLVFAGLGSQWSQRRQAGRAVSRGILRAALTIALISAVYLLWLDEWLANLSALPLAGRALLVMLLLAPLAFFMGMPFPLGLRWAANATQGLVPWAWGINGCASVISAVATPLLAIEIGFSGVILVGITAYLLLPLIVLEVRR